jgi:hypothetical protein
MFFRNFAIQDSIQIALLSIIDINDFANCLLSRIGQEFQQIFKYYPKNAFLAIHKTKEVKIISKISIHPNRLPVFTLEEPRV